jgi:AraC-like DNA-binding protein
LSAPTADEKAALATRRKRAKKITPEERRRRRELRRQLTTADKIALRNMRRDGVSRDDREKAAVWMRNRAAYRLSEPPPSQGDAGWEKRLMRDLNVAARRHGLRCCALAIMQLWIECRCSLAERAPISRRELAEHFGVAESTIRRAFAQIEEKGFAVLERDGSGEIIRVVINFKWLHSLAAAPVQAGPRRRTCGQTPVINTRGAKTPPSTPLEPHKDKNDLKGHPGEAVHNAQPEERQAEDGTEPHDTATDTALRRGLRPADGCQPPFEGPPTAPGPPG